MTIEEIKTALGDRNLAEVGRRINVSRAYLNGIRNGTVTKIGKDMHDKLARYLGYCTYV